MEVGTDSEWPCFVTLLGSPPNGCATPSNSNFFLSCGLFVVFMAAIHISPADVFDSGAPSIPCPSYLLAFLAHSLQIPHRFACFLDCHGI